MKIKNGKDFLVNQTKPLCIKKKAQGSEKMITSVLHNLKGKYGFKKEGELLIQWVKSDPIVYKSILHKSFNVF